MVAAITGTGESPFLPYIAWNKSDCSVFVGNPVLGPPLCTLITTNGSSVINANPKNSPFSAIPGPDDAVTPSDPPNAAPNAAPIPAISSSA